MTRKNITLLKAQPASSGFDFDYWRDLAKNDPAAFEAAREQEINKHITSISDDEHTQERLRRLQWRVEMERKRSKNPMDSAVRIYDMMWESVGKNIEALHDLTDHLTPGTEKQAKKESSARILKFKEDSLEMEK